MDKNEFDAMVKRSKERMLQMAQQSEFSDIDAKPAVSNITPYKMSANYEDFLTKNPKTGILKIQVYAANQAIPIKDATIIVSKEFENGKKVFYKVNTDENGIADGLILPAPDKRFSEEPSTTIPYSIYDISATHPQYVQKEDMQAQIFDGVKSIQDFNMVPIVRK